MFEGEGQETEVTTPVETESQVSDSGAAEQPQSIIDLDSLEKFRYRGKEWSREDFHKEMDVGGLRQSDYTKKLQALSEDRKYYDNLEVDLASIKKNPSLAARFKEVYPEKFHKFLGYVQSQQPQAEQEKPAFDPEEIKSLRSELNEWKSETQAERVKSAREAIDNAFSKFSSKYDMAKESDVLGAAEALIDQKLANGEKRPVLSEKEWEGIFKNFHDQDTKRADAYYSKKVQKQSQLNKEGADVASGGGTPGAPPKRHKNIREATEALLNSG